MYLLPICSILDLNARYNSYSINMLTQLVEYVYKLVDCYFASIIL